MKIAMAHQIHAYLTFVTVGPTENALGESIHVQAANAHVVGMMNVHTKQVVILGIA